MSSGSRSGAPAYGASSAEINSDAQKGSVRAARERMRAAQQRTQLPDTSRIIGLPQRPNQLVAQSNQARIDQSQQMPSQSGGRSDEDASSPPPQWPLPNDFSDPDPVIPPKSPKRLQIPQQSVRPVSDDFPIQQLSPAPASPNLLQPLALYGAPYSNEEMFSPSSLRSSRPLTTSSYASEASSLGDIPDFPVPQPPMPAIQQARRVPGLGPPPSSRRGPSSYYTQMSYVSPIVEESETRSVATRASYASSSVFPTNNRNDYFPDDDMLSDDDGTITSDRGTISPNEPDDRRGLVQQSPALLRQASLGRRTKPSLMTIKSVDSFGERKGGPSKKAVGAAAGSGAIGIGSALRAARDGTSSSPRASILSSGTGLMDPSSSSSSESVNTIKNANSKGGAFGAFSAPSSPLQQEIRPSGFAERAGMRRPPRLDMDAVRDAEARGSLTSLPELIRRATRLAANLDRGKTASRLGLDFWEAGAPEKNVRQSGLSDMLAAFPPPGRETPLRSGTPSGGSHPMSKWPSAGVNSRAGVTDSGMSNEKPKKRRRCCGMPMWTFITLLIVLLFVIAAAVVIPVVLVVIPNQNRSASSAMPENQGSGGGGNNNNNNNGNTGTNTGVLPGPTSSPNTGTDQCSGLITCQNGGIAILNSDRSCNCVCINGFTGRTCTNDDATGCTTASVAGTANNATLGSGIPRLIRSATENFDIPLDATRILSLFSSLSLSCAAENALITFNGLASRSVKHHLHSLDLRSALLPSRTLPVLHRPHLHAVPVIEEHDKRQTVGGSDETAVQDGQQDSQPERLQTQPISSNINSLDFARIGVLLALQESGDLDVAANAQEVVQTFLTDNRNGNAASNTVDLGPFEMDLVDLTIQFQNGTTIRSTPPPTSNSSR